MITVSTLRECLAVRIKRSRDLMVHAVQTSGRGFRSKVRPIAAVMLLVGQPVTGVAQSQNLDVYQPIIADAAHRFAIPPQWISAIIAAESAADPIAVSHKGAMGLMQIMPDTWQELREEHNLGADPLDPADNIVAGTAYLRQMLDRYGSVALMLAAYNAGPGRLDEHLSTGRALPTETLAYIAGLLPHLSPAYHASEQFAPRSVPSDAFASDIFVTTGGRRTDPMRQRADLFHENEPVAEPHLPMPSHANDETSGNSLFVRPATQRTP